MREAREANEACSRRQRRTGSLALALVVFSTLNRMGSWERLLTLSLHTASWVVRVSVLVAQIVLSEHLLALSALFCSPLAAPFWLLGRDLLHAILHDFSAAITPGHVAMKRCDLVEVLGSEECLELTAWNHCLAGLAGVLLPASHARLIAVEEPRETVVLSSIATAVQAFGMLCGVAACVLVGLLQFFRNCCSRKGSWVWLARRPLWWTPV